MIILEELGVSRTFVSRHLKLICKVKNVDKCVSREIYENHKSKCFRISSALLLHKQNNIFLNRIITCDEKWILYNICKRSALWLDADKAT